MSRDRAEDQRSYIPSYHHRAETETETKVEAVLARLSFFLAENVTFDLTFCSHKTNEMGLAWQHHLVIKLNRKQVGLQLKFISRLDSAECHTQMSYKIYYPPYILTLL